MNLSQNQMALALRVPARRINEIVHGKRRITADTALRLARYFDRSPQFWLGLQMAHDLDVAEDEMGDLRQEVGAIGSPLHGIVLVESIDPGGKQPFAPTAAPVGANGCLPSSSC